MNMHGCNPFLLAAILALCCITVSEQHSVVIVGAGPSGLAAATHLLANGLSDVTVLEAEARIGGRVNSVPFGDAIVELGAEWCHGQEGNVVHEMVKDLDMLEDLGNGVEIVFSDGKTLGRDRSEQVLTILLDVYGDANETVDIDKTTGEYFRPAFISAISEFYQNDTETLELALKLMPLYEQYILSLEGAFSWEDCAAISDYEECDGNQNLSWKGKGYKQIFDVMAKKLPKSDSAPLPLEDKIHFNKVVSKIKYSGAKPVVTCTDGSEYTADSVIFTPSLGVLKHDHKSLFDPALPGEKVKAIEDLGIGAVIKVIQHYNDIWWPTDLSFGLGFGWTEEDEAEVAKEFAKGPIKNGKSWLSSILSLMPAEHNPHVIYIWFTGPLVPEIELLSDDDLQTGINYFFKKFLGDKYNVTKPDKIIRSSWYSNPHFRGTYSFDTLKTTEGCRMILAKPVKNSSEKNVLFFAGEATNMIHFSTVHGAIESGHREADRIIKLQKKN